MRLDQANSYYSTTTKYLGGARGYPRQGRRTRTPQLLTRCIVLGFWKLASRVGHEYLKIGFQGFPFYTGGANAFVDARDVALAACTLMDNHKFESRFLCAAWNMKFYDVFTAIASGFGSKLPRIKVSPLLAGIAWRLASVVRFFTGAGIITKESAQAGLKTRLYDSSKLLNQTNVKFRDFDTSIKEICNAFETVKA